MKKLLPNGRAVGKGLVIVMPKAVFDTPEYRALSHRARTLLSFVHLTYSKYNNGSLRILQSEPERYGFKSRDQLSKARDELIVAGWVQVTRFPTCKRQPWLYALTWEAIDADPKEGVKGTRTPSHLWRARMVGDRETLGLSTVQPPERGFAKRPSAVIFCPVTREAKPRLVPAARETNTILYPAAREAKENAAL